MKIKPIFYYVAGLLASLIIGFWIKEYIGFVVAGAVYAILLGLIVGIFNIDPVEKSPYEKRKKENQD
jgi:hypothetical protein